MGSIHLSSSNFSNIPKFGRSLFEFSKFRKAVFEFSNFTITAFVKNFWMLDILGKRARVSV